MQAAVSERQSGLCINQVANQHAIAHSALELLIPAFSDVLSTATAKPLPPGVEKLTGRYVEETGAATIEVLIEGSQLFIAQLHEGQNVGQWEIVPQEGYSFQMKGGPLSGKVARFELDPKAATKEFAHPVQAVVGETTLQEI